MKGTARRVTGLALLGMLLFLTPAFAVAGREKPEAVAVAAQDVLSAPGADQAPTEVIHPGPQNLKERWAIGVFLVWMWLSIAVLISFICLQIRETDRIAGLGYDKPKTARPDRLES